VQRERSEIDRRREHHRVGVTEHQAAALEPRGGQQFKRAIHLREPFEIRAQVVEEDR
jgi:hypothetical protein